MDVDLIIVGAGAAGLMAAIAAARRNPSHHVLLMDSASRIGAKILISGGGRCNVTHDFVDETAFAGSSRPAIRKILRRFDAAKTVEFFKDLGVHLKREETGKLFPVTDRAQTVLDALLNATRSAGAEILKSHRVEAVRVSNSVYHVNGPWGTVTAPAVILATGGQSVPATGSDGHGYEIARLLGHSVTRTFPALVPLLLPRNHFLCELSGLSGVARFDVRDGNGKAIMQFTDSFLCTHFGLSGPAVLDISRYYLDALHADEQAKLVADWIPQSTAESLDAELRAPGTGTVLSRLRGNLPERLLRAVAEHAGVDPTASCAQLNRESRQLLVRSLTQMILPITGSRGFRYAEVTAGGVPLSELRLETLESRICPGLYLCGEICDVDGRIGGYNFQWAWSSGFVAGHAAAAPNREKAFHG